MDLDGNIWFSRSESTSQSHEAYPGKTYDFQLKRITSRVLLREDVIVKLWLPSLFHWMKYFGKFSKYMVYIAVVNSFYNFVLKYCVSRANIFFPIVLIYCTFLYFEMKSSRNSRRSLEIQWTKWVSQSRWMAVWFCVHCMNCFYWWHSSSSFPQP